MNTHVFTLRRVTSRSGHQRSVHSKTGGIALADIVRTSARLVVAGGAASSLFIFATWAALTPSLAQYLSAGMWAVGFIFFALAIEPGMKRVNPLVATGLALPALAILGSRVSEGFTIAAAAIVAAWLAAWLAQRD